MISHLVVTHHKVNQLVNHRQALEQYFQRQNHPVVKIIIIYIKIIIIYIKDEQRQIYVSLIYSFYYIASKK